MPSVAVVFCTLEQKKQEMRLLIRLLVVQAVAITLQPIILIPLRFCHHICVLESVDQLSGAYPPSMLLHSTT